MQDAERLNRLSPDGQLRLSHLSGVLAQAFAQRGRQHPRRWLEGVWLMLGGPRCLEGPEGLADIDAFFALIDKLVAAHTLTAENLSAKTAELFAPPDPLAGDAVQMMTIHKSKGLEFETVILPSLHRKTGGNDSQLLLWDNVIGADGEEHLLVAPIKAKGAAGGEPTTYDYLKKLESERSAHEVERLLYVAATRAIRCLHLVGCAEPNGNKDNGLNPPANGTLLNLLWPNLAEPVFVAALASSTITPGLGAVFDQAGFAPPLLRLAQVGVPVELDQPLVGAAQLENPLDADTAANVQAFEAAVGTLIHRCLELIAKQGVDHWPVEKPATLLSAYRRWLLNAGVDADDAVLGADLVVSALQTTLQSEAGIWVLADHPGASAEQGWSSKNLGDVGVAQHVIDRVFVADGYRWIVDYKTVRLPKEALAARAESYRPQLERYAGLFKGDPLPVQMAIYFPVQGVLHKLPA
jgi:ATP-dependent exoDNAse (exonuclease V) beta subunit